MNPSNATVLRRRNPGGKIAVFAIARMVKAQDSTNNMVRGATSAVDALHDTLYKVGGAVVMAMGLMTLMSGLKEVGTAFAPKEAPAVAPAQQEEHAVRMEEQQEEPAAQTEE